MIRIFDGVPGSGKSYHAVEEILRKLVGGAHVVTNLPLHWEVLCELAARSKTDFFGRTRPGVVLEPGQLTLLDDEQTKDFFSFMPEGTLECPTEGFFDELQNMFNSRNWAETQKKHGHVLKFVSHHRHYHTNLTLLTQSRGNIDKQFRVMCAEYWEHLDLNKWTLLGVGWPLPQFLRKMYSGEDEKTRLKANFKWKNPDIWRCYDSHNKVPGIELSRQVSRLQLAPATTTQKERIANMFRAWLIISVIGIAAICWVWNYIKPKPQAAAAPRASVVAGVLPATPAPAPGLSVPAQQVGSFLAPKPPVAVVPSIPTVPVDQIITEHLRYAEGDRHRRTDKASYTLGRMCPSGRVEAVADDCVTVRRPDGGLLYVILDGASYVEQPLVAPIRTPAPVAAVVLAPARPAPVAVASATPSYSALESARISASLKNSPGGMYALGGAEGSPAKPGGRRGVAEGVIGHR